MYPPVPLALATWSVSLDEPAVLAGVPAFVCVSLFMVAIGAKAIGDELRDRGEAGL